jgi:hypothetical protein
MSGPCSITCSISAVFIIAMIFMTNWMSTNETTQTYYKQLPENLKETYNEILKERRQIYYTGYGIGFFLAMVLIFYNLKIKKDKMGWKSMLCATISLSFITNYFYYILTPKRKMMLNSIDTPEQTKAWVEMYRTMQVYYHGSLVIGLISVGALSLAFRCE